MRRQRAFRNLCGVATGLCLFSISANKPTAPVHTFLIDFALDKAPKVLRPGVMARDLSKKLDGYSTGNIKFAVRPQDDEEPCGKDPNCDLVTVKETGDESERPSLQIVLTVMQAKVPKRHPTREYPLEVDAHACEYPPANRESWNKCIDAYAEDMFIELRAHVRDDHPTPGQD